MQRIAIGSELVIVTAAASSRRFHLPGRLAHVGDLERRVTILARRHGWISSLQSFAVNTGEIGGFNSLMAGAASGRDVGTVGAALGVFLGQNVMGAVTTRAGGGDQKAIFGQREAVNGVYILGVHVGQSVFLDEILVAMAGSTSARQVERIDRRFRILSRENAMRIAVTA